MHESKKPYRGRKQIVMSYRVRHSAFISPKRECLCHDSNPILFFSLRSAWLIPIRTLALWAYSRLLLYVAWNPFMLVSFASEAPDCDFYFMNNVIRKLVDVIQIFPVACVSIWVWTGCGKGYLGPVKILLPVLNIFSQVSGTIPIRGRIV